MNRDESSADTRLFDQHAGRYWEILAKLVNCAGERPDYFARYKLERLLALCGPRPPVHVIDIGCGVGLLTELLAGALPATRVTGLDVSAKSVEQAASRCARLANVGLFMYDGHSLPPGIGGADLVVLANVFHHVTPPARPAFIERIVRPALSPGGRVVVFEHNPYNPVTRLVVRLCPFDRDARLVSLRAAVALLHQYQFRVSQRAYIVFFPRFLRALRRLEGRMGSIPLGAQFMVVAEPE